MEDRVGKCRVAFEPLLDRLEGVIDPDQSTIHDLSLAYIQFMDFLRRNEVLLLHLHFHIFRVLVLLVLYSQGLENMPIVIILSS